MLISKVWEKIFSDYGIGTHDFAKSPFFITTSQIEASCQHLASTSKNQWVSLSKQNKRESRPDIFIRNDLFLLPVKRGKRAIVKGEGYFDIPEISFAEDYSSRLDFQLDSVGLGSSQIQCLDFAHASGLISSFIEDDSLQLTLRGRYHIPFLEFNVAHQGIKVENAQINIDAGYEGRDKLVLVKIKNSPAKNFPVRQLYYPYRYWKTQTSKEISLILFEKRQEEYLFWQYQFKNALNYNSLGLVKSVGYKVTTSITHNQQNN